MIKFRCHKCNKKIGVHEAYAARRVLCPRCNIPTQIPEPDHSERSTQDPNDKTLYSVLVDNGAGKTLAFHQDGGFLVADDTPPALKRSP